jgi:hypothetical protein
MKIRWIEGALLALFVFVLAPGLMAQDRSGDEPEGIRITGTVVDLSSGAIVPAASLRLSPADASEPSHQALSDEDGRFELVGVPPGMFQLEVQALGFHEMGEQIEVGERGPVDIRIEIVPQALELEPVVVTVTRRGYLERTGFYSRRQRGVGTHLTRDQFVQRANFQVSDVFRTIPGARVTERSGLGRTADVSFRGGCRPDVFIDGIQTVAGTSVDEVLAVQDVEAMEVYRGATVPVEFSRGSCGAVVVWTREPGQGTQPFSWRRLLAGAGFVAGALLLTR